jgi:hypothetical protein
LSADDPAWPRARTRLFLSADIAGSTAFKQRRSDDSTPTARWGKSILSFYRDFGQNFLEKLKLAKNAVEQQLSKYAPCERPLFWKAVGDEVLFCVELLDERQGYVVLAAWINAAREYKKTLQKDRLDIKLAAWVATFPTPNFEVLLPRALNGHDTPQASSGDPLLENWDDLERYYSGDIDFQRDHTLDFIGPAMDTGFRIAQLSTTRKMAITPELARLVAVTHDGFKNQPHLNSMYKLDLRYQGRINLKGVSDPSGYPVFWLDTADADDAFVKSEDSITANRGDIPSDQLHYFLLTYLGTHAPFKAHLYLPNGEHNDYSKLHPDLQDELKQIQKRYDREEERLQGEMSLQNETDQQTDMAKVTQGQIDQLAPPFSDKTPNN